MVFLQNESVQERLNIPEAQDHAPMARLWRLPAASAKGVLVSMLQLLVRKPSCKERSANAVRLSDATSRYSNS
jgi:hypothetical protein